MGAAACLLLLLVSPASAELVVDPRAQPGADLELVEVSPAAAPRRAKARPAKRPRHRAKAAARAKPAAKAGAALAARRPARRVQWLYVREAREEPAANPDPAAEAAAVSASLDPRDLLWSEALGPGVARDTVRKSVWKSLREE